MKNGACCVAAVVLFVAVLPLALNADDKLYDQGKQLYNSNCRVCHINRAEGDRPTPYYLRFRPGDFANASFWRGNTEKKITEALRKGKPPMPAFPNFTPEDIKAVIYYLSLAFKPS